MSEIHVEATHSFPNDVAQELAAAYLEAIANSHGIRILFFKGRAAVRQSVRPTGAQGADIDALVDPAGFESLVLALVDQGWLHRPVIDDELRLIRYHSVTLVHRDWPIDLDLHYYIPGFFVDATSAFEVLWASHEEIVLAGRHVKVPQARIHLLLLLVNAIRDWRTEKGQLELQRLASVFHEDLELWGACLASSKILRCGSVIQPYAREFSLPLPSSDLSSEEWERWNRWVRGKEPGTEAVRLAFTTGPLHGIRTLAQMAFRGPREIQAYFPSFEPSIPNVILFNLQRGLRGAKSLLVKKDNEVQKHDTLSRVESGFSQEVRTSPSPELGPSIQVPNLPPINAQVFENTFQVSPNYPDLSETDFSQEIFVTARCAQLVKNETIYILLLDWQLHDQHMPYVFEGTARSIWETIYSISDREGSVSLKQVVHTVAKKYETTPHIVYEDILDFFRTLSSRKLINVLTG